VIVAYYLNINRITKPKFVPIFTGLLLDQIVKSGILNEFRIFFIRACNVYI